VNLYQVLTDGLGERLLPAGVATVVVGVVTSNDDPDKQGRVKVKYPWLAPDEESAWARVVAPLGGKARGWLFLPEVDDEVLVAFELGDVSRPYVMGGLWNGKDTPPTSDGDGRDRRLLKSRSGHIVRFDDTDGAEKIEIIDKTGKNSIVFDAAQNTITITSDKDIVLKASQGKITLDAKEIEVKSSAAAKVEASGDLTLKGATVNIN
jgi:uncharacterized protein involved in type VI secretion and phage assembly